MPVNADDSFRPDWISPPGNTISDILEERKIDKTFFRNCIGLGSEELEKLLSGQAEITSTLAQRLSHSIGASVGFWIAREREYREGLKLATQSQAVDDVAWLRELPYQDMVKFDWVPRASSLKEKIDNCLNFFNVQSIGAWREQYKGILQAAAFRTSMTFEATPGAVATWLRKGEIEAASIDCKTWNKESFSAAMSEIRPLTRKKDPDQFIPPLRAICKEHGVAFVVARAPMGCRASGATRFLSPSKALLLLSFRYLSDDHFWFTFFHEAGHLILHSQKALFLEGEGMDATHEEDEANDFSADILIPKDKEVYLMQDRYTAMEIIRVARIIGVSPGVVVGQLQHRGVLRRNQLNSLKRRFSWD